MPLKVKSMLRKKDRRDSQSTIESLSSQNEAASLSGAPSPAVGYQIKNPKKELNHKLHRAVWKNNDAKVCKLVTEKDRKGNPKHSLVAVDKCNRTALHLAACSTNLRIVGVLLEGDGTAAMQIKDKDGNTPIYKAVECDRFDVLKKFEKAAHWSVNLPNNVGQTPMHLAALKNNVQMGDKLLNFGAFVDAKDNEGYTPLALAVLHNCSEFVDFLDKEDATADAFNEKGETPLILAVRAGNTAMVKKLLGFRMIDIDLKDDGGKDAMDYASELESKDIKNMIKKYCKENLAMPFDYKSETEEEGPNPPRSVADFGFNALPVLDRGYVDETTEDDTSTVDVPRRESVDTFFSDTEEKPPSEPKINLYAKFKENMPELFDSDDDFGEDVKEKQGASGKLDQPSTEQTELKTEEPSELKKSNSVLLATPPPPKSPTKEDPGFIYEEESVVSKPARAKGSPAILSREIPTLMPTFDRPGFPALEVKTDEELFKPKESSPTALSRRTSSKSPSASGSGFIYGEPVSEVKADKEPVNPKESSPTALSRRTSSKSPSASGSGFIYGEPVSDLKSPEPTKLKQSTPIRSRRTPLGSPATRGLGFNYGDPLSDTDFSADNSDIDMPMEKGTKSGDGSSNKKLSHQKDHPAIEPKNDVQELLEKGWDSDISSDGEEPVKNKKRPEQKRTKGSTKDSKHEDFWLTKKEAKPEEKNDILELLEDGWDSEEEEEEEEEEEVVMKNEKLQFEEKKEEIPKKDVPVAEGRDDVQELLEKGWDSDISSDGEELEKAEKQPEQKLIKDSVPDDLLPIKKEGKKTEPAEKDDIRELLEDGWDSDEEEEEEEEEEEVMREEKAQVDKDKEATLKRAVFKDEVQELLKQNSRNSDILSDKGKPERNKKQPEQKMTQGGDILPIKKEKKEANPQGRDDIQELLEDGWDSEEEEEEGEGGDKEMREEKAWVEEKKKEETPNKATVVHAAVERKVDIQELLKQDSDSDISSDEEEPEKNKKQPEQKRTQEQIKNLSHGDLLLPIKKEKKQSDVKPQEKNDIQELLEDGWDSEEEEEEEEMNKKDEFETKKERTPKENSFLSKKNTPKFTRPKESMTELSTFSVDSQDIKGKSPLSGVKKHVPSANSTPEEHATEFTKEGSYRPTQLLPLISSPSSCDELIPEAQKYNRSFRKYEELYEEKRKLEIAKMDQEVEIRRLKYQLEQAEEEIQSANEEKKKLTDQLLWNENKIAKELQNKQSLELSWKETEIQNKTITASYQQMKEELEELKGLLVSEREEKALKVTALAQQQELYQKLTLEATKTNEHKTKMAELLSASDAGRNSLEAKLSEQDAILASTNERLTDALTDKMQLLNDIEAAEKKAADAEARLREEKDNSISKLQEKHSLELKLQEVEIKQQALTASREQLKAELEDTKSLLRVEQDQKTQRALEASNQEELYKRLQQEMKGIVEEKARLSGLLESADHIKTTLESRISELEGSLGAANERLATELASKVQLMKDMGEAERKVNEKKAVLEEEKNRHFSIVEHLKADVKKAELEAVAKLEQVVSVKEQLASTEMAKAVLEKEVQELKKEISSSIDLNAQMQERLGALQRAYEEIEKEREGLEEVIGRMNQEASAREYELKETRKVAKKYQEVVDKAQETLMLTARERDQALAEKADLQTQIIDFEGKVNCIVAELNQYEKQEESLQKELEELKKSRSSLQDMATKLRSENVSLEHQLADEVAQKERAQSENKELKEIWESEVKAKHKLTEKIMELEMLQRNNNGSVSQEKRRMRKIIEQKGILEMKLETLQEKNGGLQRENGELKAGLRAARRRAKDLEDTLRSKHELDLNRSVDNSEVISLHKEIGKLQEQLRNEGEHRMTAESRSRQIEQELQSTQQLLEATRNEALGKKKTDEQHISKLTEEIRSLQDHVQGNTVSKVDYDVIRNELKESDCENKRFAKEICDLRENLRLLLASVDQLKMENEVVASEAVRYKNMLERETAKREKVAAKLDRTRARAAFSESRLNMERVHTGRMLDLTYRQQTQKPSLTSTPMKYEPQASIVDDDLIEEVRLSLDRSVSDHKDIASVFRTTQSKSLKSDVESHLDSIKRQYRL